MYGILPEKLIYLASACPFPLYVVGGSVRDFIAGFGTENCDVDVCAPVTAEEFAKRATAAGFSADAVYRNTGTVKFSYGGESFEFASFRSDEYERGVHTPVNSCFTDDIFLDARRRDFKCNAVYYLISERKFVDPLGGTEDIKNKKLSTVAPSEKVFGEDGLRLMRLARIAAQTGFKPDKECMNGACANAHLISDVSAERIFSELNAILHADERYGVDKSQYFGLKILKDTGVLKYILPELYDGNGMVQRSDFHKYDVLEHSLRTVAYAPTEIRLAALLHDIGKPYCFNTTGKFAGHEVIGATIAGKVCARLKVPKKLTEETVNLVFLHMYDLRCDAKENKVRKFIIKNFRYFNKLLLLKQADFSACMDDLSPAPSALKMKSIYERMRAENIPFTLKDLDVRGNELIEAGVPSQKTGSILEGLLLDCAVGQVKNTKDELIRYALKVYLR